MSEDSASKEPRDRGTGPGRGDSAPARIRKPLSMASRRIPLGRRVTLDFPDCEGILTATVSNVSMTGMFVRSERIEDPGTRADFELDLSGDQPRVRGRAEVVWGRSRDEGLGRPAGMGFRFIDLGSEQEGWIRQAVEEQLRRGVAELKLDLHPGLEPGQGSSEQHPYAGVAVAQGASNRQDRPRSWLAVAVVAGIVLAAFLGRSVLTPSVDPGPRPPASPESGDEAPPAAAPAEAGPANSQEATHSQVLEAVSAWAEAWSRQDVEAYLASYSRDFQPPGGVSREVWTEQRRGRISRPRRISVRLSDVAPRLSGHERCRVSFLQVYESESYRDATRKELELTLEQGEWKIVAERSSS